MANGTVLCVVQRFCNIGPELESHRSATSGPGNQYIIAQLIRAVGDHGSGRVGGLGLLELERDTGED